MQPLDGIKVVSFNHFLAGPAAMQTLGDLGADIVAVEPIEGAFQRKWSGGDRRINGESLLFLSANRNKRSLALNLKSETGVVIARRLVRCADIVAENFRPGVMEGLGLGYEAVRAENPRVIYASVTGYGADGPYVRRPGQDMLVQALSGLAAVTGDPTDGARAIGISAVDHHGAMILAMAILAALLNRGKTGEGCRVDVNLLSSAIDLQMEAFTCYLNGTPPETIRHPQYSGGWLYPAPYGVYPTADGHLAISFASMATMAETLEAEELKAIRDDEVFTRRGEIIAVVARSLRRKPTQHWVRVLEEENVWHAPVQDYAAVAEDPQVMHLGSFETVPSAAGPPITLVKHPVKYDGSTPGVRLPPQPLGAQSAEILRELDYTAEEITQFAEEGIIGLRTPDEGEHAR